MLNYLVVKVSINESKLEKMKFYLILLFSALAGSTFGQMNDTEFKSAETISFFSSLVRGETDLEGEVILKESHWYISLIDNLLTHNYV